MANDATRVLILGGNSSLGEHVISLLVRDPRLSLVIAAFDGEMQDLCARFEKTVREPKITPLLVDWQSQDLSLVLREQAISVLIDVAGPFQDYTVARACIQSKVHYFDLAETREFVIHIRDLDPAAKEARVVVISGANKIPGLSSAVVTRFAKKFSILREVELGVAIGSSGSCLEDLSPLLKGIGGPFRRLEKGRWKTVYGAQGVHPYYYGDNVGFRWHANRNIPDLELLPERYPFLKTVVFHSDVGNTVLHWLLWQISWFVRFGVIRKSASFLKPLTALHPYLNRFQKEKSGMYVCMRGSNHQYQPLEICWQLVTQEEEYVSAAISWILVDKLIRGDFMPGAQPCFGVFGLEEWDAYTASWDTYYTVEEKEM